MSGRGTNVSIAPSAIVEWGAGATIGDDTRIDHHAVVRRNAVIGARCVIGVGAYIEGGAVIGDDCRIQNGAQITDGVELHDAVFVGAHVVFTIIPSDEGPRAPRGEYVPTVVERGASIGANATIGCVRIGRYAMITPGMRVTRDVPPHILVTPAPGQDRLVCVCGFVLPRSTSIPGSILYAGVRANDTVTCRRCSRAFTVTCPDGAWTVTLQETE